MTRKAAGKDISRLCHSRIFPEADPSKPEYTGEADDEHDSGNEDNDEGADDNASDDEERPVNPTDAVYRPAKSQPVIWEICEAIQDKQGQYSNPVKDDSGRRRRFVLAAEMILEARKKGTDPVINWGRDGNVRVEYEITEDDIERAFLIHIGSGFIRAQSFGFPLRSRGIHPSEQSESGCGNEHGSERGYHSISDPD